jgi:hypothetical protein
VSQRKVVYIFYTATTALRCAAGGAATVTAGLVAGARRNSRHREVVAGFGRGESPSGVLLSAR